MASQGGSGGAPPMPTAADELTYEHAQAHRAASSLPDPIAWSTEASYRSSPYRQLHHQGGTIGTFTVRLLEAKDLTRSHWSALALGPVRHLGLSTAHGEVSSYVTVGLGFRYGDDPRDATTAAAAGGVPAAAAPAAAAAPSAGSSAARDIASSASADAASASSTEHSDKKPAAKSELLHAHSASAISPDDDDDDDDDDDGAGHDNLRHGRQQETYRSSTVRNNSNPVWPSSQSDGNRSLFDVPLRKGAMPTDGQRIYLRVRVDEETTGVESMIPNPFGIMGRGGDGTVGTGEVDVTGLVLGEVGSGVMDAWVDLSSPGNGGAEDAAVAFAASAAAAAASSSSSSSSSITKQPSSGSRHGDGRSGGGRGRGKSKNAGQVRVLVSYQPHGLTPRRGDVAALESFARRSPGRSGCRPMMPPLRPFRVLEVMGPYVLVEYALPATDKSTLTRRDRKRSAERDRENRGRTRLGTARIHRNAIFVIERRNIVDSAVNLALAPADAVLSTPLGRATSRIAMPIVEMAGDLAAPAIITGKLMLSGVNTVGAAGLSGVGAAVSTVARSIDPNSKYRERDPLRHYEA